MSPLCGDADACTSPPPCIRGHDFGVGIAESGNTGSSRVDLNDYESERQKFLAEGGCPGKIASEIFSVFFRFCTHQSPPSTFSLPCPYASKNTAVARYCSRSCKRNLVQVVATRFLTPLMERLFSDLDQLFHFLHQFSKLGGPPPLPKGFQENRRNQENVKENEPRLGSADSEKLQNP